MAVRRVMLCCDMEATIVAISACFNDDKASLLKMSVQELCYTKPEAKLNLN
jgi:hypothetical protein